MWWFLVGVDYSVVFVFLVVEDEECWVCIVLLIINFFGVVVIGGFVNVV